MPPWRRCRARGSGRSSRWPRDSWFTGSSVPCWQGSVGYQPVQGLVIFAQVLVVDAIPHGLPRIAVSLSLTVSWIFLWLLELRSLQAVQAVALRRPRTPRGRFLSTGGNSPGLWCRRQAQHMHFIASPTISIQKQRAVGSTETSLLCHVGGFYPRDVDAAWLRDGRVLGSTRSSPQRNLDGTFSLALTYTFTPAKSDTGSLLLPPRWRKSSASGTLVSGGGAGARVTLFLGWGIQPRSLPQRKPQKMRGHGGEGGNVAQQQHRCDAAQPQK
uniref:Ig-like domain-containing protein n=1 Tax=Crocodylus porosus TaxID=8502 RepID=A0A7M4FPD2_CROPO